MPEDLPADWLTPRDHARKQGIFRVRSKRERDRESALADWIGDPDDAEVEIGAHKRDGSSISALCEAVLDSLDTPNRRAMRILIGRWPEVAGGFASQSSPRSLREDGALFVAVGSATLAFQLRLQERLFLQRIAALPVPEVKAIRFIPAGATISERFDHS